jgi:hypothetical protein
VNNDDLHNIDAMTSGLNDEEDDVKLVSDSDDENDGNVIEPEDVVRHFWRGSDIKYL